jgi:hypothetical protein
MGGGAPATQQATATNPYLTDLQQLRSRLTGEVAKLQDSLKTTCSDMGGKKVWVGKTADTWTTDVTGRRNRIQILVGKIIPIIDAEIKRTPPKVTPVEAKLYRMQ